MYSLLESCKLNNINIGEYVEGILTRIMQGEIVVSSFLPQIHHAKRMNSMLPDGVKQQQYYFFLNYFSCNLLENKGYGVLVVYLVCN